MKHKGRVQLRLQGGGKEVYDKVEREEGASVETAGG